MQQSDIDKLIAMKASNEVIFIGPYSNTSRFVEKVRDDGYAELDNGNVIALRPDCTVLSDFAIVMRLSS